MEKEQLLKEWLKLKKAETKAKKSRAEIELQIEELYGKDFKEKSKTFKEDGFAINIKKNIVMKLDQDAWLTVRADIQENLRPEKISFSIDEKGYEWLKANEPEIYKKVSDCVEIKENKSTIKVEKI